MRLEVTPIMNKEEINNLISPKVLDVKDRGLMRFHNWASQDIMVYIGRTKENNTPYTLEISRDLVNPEGDGTVSFAEPYEAEYTSQKKDPLINRMLIDLLEEVAK